MYMYAWPLRLKAIIDLNIPMILRAIKLRATKFICIVGQSPYTIHVVISRCQGYSRVIKVTQFLPVYIIIITQ